MPWTGSTSTSGMLRAARAKLLSTAAPSMISALLSPSLTRFFCSEAVLASFTLAFSSTMMPPSLALADSACLRARARTFLGRSIAWLRGVGPNERPPPRNRLTRAEPWRAEPVPFCRYIFLPVRWISARFLTSWVPRWRLASCQRTQRCRMSGRGSRPKMASGSSTEPAASPSSDMTFSSMSRALLCGRLRAFGGLVVGSLGRARLGGRQPELAGLRRFLRELLLHGIAQRDPAALGAGDRALDQNEAALDVGLHHLEIERGDAIDAHMAGHLLVLEGLARVLPAAGRADRAVRDRHAVRSAQTTEIPALHAAGKAFADRGAGDVDELADDEMVGGDLGADRDQAVLLDPELGELALGLDVDAGGEIELHQRVHRLRRRIDDIEQALVRAHLELLAALLVDVRRSVDGEFLDPGRQRDRPAHLRAGALGGRHDLACRSIENAMIERLEPDPYVLAVHDLSDDG